MRFLALWCAAALPLFVMAQDRGLLLEAEQAYAQGNPELALKLADQYVASAPTDAKGFLLRAAIRDVAAGREKAIADYDKAIGLDPKLAIAYQRRGVAHFMLGHAKESVADFDKYLDMRPDEKPGHWQRGIALYYAGQYEEGAKQFELHRTVNPADVENAAWHFLCVARWKTPAAARAALIPIEGDDRVPMGQVHELFAGKMTIDDVMRAAKAADANPVRLNRHLFYAHLYVGLYCEATGDAKGAAEHLREAVKHELPDYMYGVARVHVGRLAGETRGPKPAP